MDPAVSTLTPMNTRQAFVGVEKDGVGRLDFGTMYTPHHLTMARFSPSTLPNVPGAVDYTQSVGSNGLGQTLDKFGIIAVNRFAIAAVTPWSGLNTTSPTSTTLLGKINEMNNALINAGLSNGTANATTTTAPTVSTAGAIVAQVDFATSSGAAVASGLNSAISTVNSRVQTTEAALINARLARGNNTSYTVRNNNTVNYQSPTINGFQAGIAYALPTQTKATGLTAVGSNDESTSSIMMLNAAYTAGNFAAAAAYSSGVATTVTSTARVSASTAITVPDGLETLVVQATDLAPTSTTANITRQETAARITTVEVKTTETMGAASYNFGPAKVSYIYTKRAAKDTVSDLSEKTAHNFGVKAPFGATTAFASYTTGSQTILGNTANQNKFDLRGIQAGVSYALSKRTDAYAIYGTQTMDNKATTIDTKDTGYAVGVRHTF